MTKRWFRSLLGGLSFTAALFIFQACYGTPNNFEPGIKIEGKVCSSTSGDPIEGIHVYIPLSGQYEQTDAEGHFEMWTEDFYSISLRFMDTDSSENLLYAGKDTILIGPDKEAFLEISLDEIQ